MNNDFFDFAMGLIEAKKGFNPSAIIQVGTDEDLQEKFGLPVEGTESGLGSTHTYVLGSSGVGKTKFLEGLVRQIIEKGYGVVVLDGKAGETCLYENLVSHCNYLDLQGYKLADKTILIDPNDDKYSVGINYLELMGKQSPDALAGLVLEAIKKFFKEEEETKVWLEQWLMLSLVPLIKAGFTLAELESFLDLEDPRFRDAVLEQLDEGFYKRSWVRLQGLKRHEQEMRLGAAATRASKFLEFQILKTIFGQQKTSVDWLKVMEEGGIVLAKLGVTSNVPDFVSGLIGMSILDQIRAVASERPAHKRRPFFFVVDEFQRFVTADYGDGLDTLREYGISFVLSHQHRTQLDDEENRKVLKSIDANCRNKIIFGCDREDAELITPAIYAGLLHKGAEEVKDEIWQTKQRAILTWHDIVSHSESVNESRTTSTTQGVAMGINTQEQLGSSQGYTYPMNTQYGAGTFTSTSNRGSGRSSSVVDTEQQGESQTIGSSRSTTSTLTPVVEHKDFREMSSRTYYGLDEVTERYVSNVSNQLDRHAQWKFKAEYPIPIVTPYIKSVDVPTRARQRFRAVSHSQYARLTDEVNQEIEERVGKYLQLGEASEPVGRKGRNNVE